VVPGGRRPPHPQPGPDQREDPLQAGNERERQESNAYGGVGRTAGDSLTDTCLRAGESRYLIDITAPAIDTIAAAMAESLTLPGRLRMKLRSIFTLWMRRVDRYEKPEYSVPKSSIENCTPLSARVAIRPVVLSRFVMRWLSVISTVS
jgi:hypothetical protein